MRSETHITNLLYRYADAIDSGDLERAARLFAHARIRLSHDRIVGADELLENWRTRVRFRPDGTPGTKHVVTNPIIEVDEGAGSATCQSYYTVLQAVDGLPLQAIAVGRYLDEFERVEDGWRFSFRDYSLLDLRGDLSHHLL